MKGETYANIGRNAAPLYDYDFTQEYLARLRGHSYIPVRKSSDYKDAPVNGNKSNYLTPRMRKLIKSRKPAKRI